MKKVLCRVVISIVVLGIAFFLFKNLMQSGVTGQWDLATGDEGCFTGLNFTDGPPRSRVISFDEVTGNTKKVYRGLLETKGNKMTVSVDNFDHIEPFKMIYEQSNDQLILKYSWEDHNYSCTYEKVE